MHSFVYIPAIEGYDDSTWKTLSGAPEVYGEVLHLTESSCATLAYGTRGQVTIRLRIPEAPSEDVSGDREWGFNNIGTGQNAFFRITGDTFQAIVNDEDVATLVWDDATMTDTYLNFSIRWEAGIVRFFINETNVANGSDPDDFPDMPMFIYLLNENEDDMRCYSIAWTGIQSLYLPADAQDGVFTTDPSQEFSEQNEAVGITEDTQVAIRFDLSVGEDLTITEDAPGS